MQFKKEVKFGDMSPPATTKEPDKSGESSCVTYMYIHKYCSSLLAVTDSGLICGALLVCTEHPLSIVDMVVEQ